MDQTSKKIRLAAIIAVAVVVVSFGAARITLRGSSGMPFEHGRSFYSHKMPGHIMSPHAMPWRGRADIWNMSEAEREAFFENAKNLRPSFSERYQLIREKSPAVLVLFPIGMLGILTLASLGLLCINLLAKKLNVICKGDGRTTAGALKFLLLGIISFGIYNLLWLYMLCDRLQDTAPRYNLSFKESGGMVLLWFTLGSIIFVGPFIALYIIIKNTNALETKYDNGAQLI